MLWSHFRTVSPQFITVRASLYTSSLCWFQLNIAPIPCYGVGHFQAEIWKISETRRIHSSRRRPLKNLHLLFHAILAGKRYSIVMIRSPRSFIIQAAISTSESKQGSHHTSQRKIKKPSARIIPVNSWICNSGAECTSNDIIILILLSVD